MHARYRPAALWRLTRKELHRSWLNYGVLWVGAILVGLAAVQFANWANEALAIFLGWIDGRVWLALLITPALTGGAVWMTRKWFNGSEGSGIPQVIAVLHAPPDDGRIGRLFGLRILIGKIGLGLMGMLGGLTLGREGPTVHVGASIMYEMRRFYPRVTPRMQRLLLLAGSAAGLSGAFNTPLAGILFAIEELTRSFETRTNGVLITSIVFSGLVSLALAGNYLYFGQISAPDIFPLAFVIPVVISAVLCGLAGAAFNLALLKPARWIPARLLVWREHSPLVWGAGLGLLVAVIGIATAGQTWGSGYEQARHLLMNQGEQVSWYYPLAKWLAMVLSYITGLPGGLFSPSLSIGAGFGQWVSQWFGQYPQSALVAICMVGYLAAVTQSPLTSFVIVMEMINGGGLVIPLMATALISSRVANFFTPPLYEALAEQKYFAPLGREPQPGAQAAQAAVAASADEKAR
ncbi:MAG: chloride channel protein [Thiomonas sp.]|uniref:chloride channel protein n=1 Tax=Thiomonas sp. TaxID=2047785 RepID=UPI002A36B6D6|nr:chloride channel protein [Thiomonas sp.]MDY0330897.1 chloride channel protein [Thiomonas sp.]